MISTSLQSLHLTSFPNKQYYTFLKTPRKQYLERGKKNQKPNRSQISTSFPIRFKCCTIYASFWHFQGCYVNIINAVLIQIDAGVINEGVCVNAECAFVCALKTRRNVKPQHSISMSRHTCFEGAKLDPIIIFMKLTNRTLKEWCSF